MFLIPGVLFLALGIYFLTAGGVLATIGYTFAPLGVVIIAIGLLFRRMGGNRSRLMQTGVPGTAVVKSVEETSMRVNDNPVLKLDLQVAPMGMTPFETSMRTPVSVVTLSQVSLKPGATLPVKVDPQKPTNFVIDWNAAAAQPDPQTITV